MKAPTTKIRFSEAVKLLDFGFSKFSFKDFGKKGDLVKSINVDKGINPNVEAILSDNIGAIVEKGKENNVEQIINLEENLQAPIEQGQKLRRNFNFIRW